MYFINIFVDSVLNLASLAMSKTQNFLFFLQDSRIGHEYKPNARQLQTQDDLR